MTFDRCSGERAKPLAELLAEPNARAIVTDGTRFAIDNTRLARIEVTECDVFLGREDAAPLFLARGETEHMLDFRAAAALLPPDDVALLSYALGMLNWSARTRFCGACGSALESRGAGYSRACPHCKLEVFPRLDPAVMILATHEGRLLLARHQGRIANMWSTLAGFVEPGETLEEAVARELFEEAGLVAKTIRYFGSQPWPLPASLMIGFEVETESDAIRIDETELIEARFFRREDLDDITTSSRISLSGQMIGAWRATRSAAPRSD
ncbi:MAG TPA: NAD(+) diphosphatase [Thermoanaerobaculia bacterium]|nr:NAD(+) diphosphatase [Thermoanaerobaculia bacterium]